MRDLVELYKIILNDFKINFRSYWICNNIKYCSLLSSDERVMLLNNFQSQKPSETQYVEFFNDKGFYRKNSEWWGRLEKQVRVEFLEAIINKLEKNLVE